MDNEELTFNMLVSNFLARDCSIDRARLRAIKLIKSNHDYLEGIREWEHCKDSLKSSIHYSLRYSEFIKFLNEKIGFESTGISLSDDKEADIVIRNPEVNEQDFSTDLTMDRTVYEDFIEEFITAKDVEIYGQ